VRVFLSYSSVDKRAVRRLADDLTAAGIEVWLDEREVSVGDPVSSRIQDGIASADYVAVWLTQSAVSSEWVQREWGAKLSKEIADRSVMVLPLLAESCEIPALLADKRYADFRSSYDDGLDALLARLGGRRHWTQEALEAYLVDHHRAEEFERSDAWGADYALITSSLSSAGWRGIFWNTHTNTLGVWERVISSRWHGPEPLNSKEIQEVLQRLRSPSRA
jgi:TIR domain